jgi:ADP-heptose:LPS heptosyltransferase
LGDVMLATPVLRRIRELHPEAHLCFLVQKAWMPVLQLGSEVELIPFDPSESLERLSERLKQHHFQIAYVLRDESLVSRAVKKAQIPVRVGPYSTLRSFFAFNRGKLQKRSRCLMHEAEYNLELIGPVVPAQSPSDLPRSWVGTTPEARVRATEFLSRVGLRDHDFVVIHPGSSGSARYVHPEKLYALARMLVKRGHPVMLSGGPLESEILKAFQNQVPEVILMGSEEGLGLDGMAEVYRKAAGVIAHGTGPLHLAAAVGVPVLAVFPPLFVLSEKRWGPLTQKRTVWTPGVPCPEKYRCSGAQCRYYDCMNLFNGEEALLAVEKWYA